MFRSLNTPSDVAAWNSTHDRFLVGLILGAICLSMFGCGKPEFQRIPVAGTVKVDGKPLEKGAIQFSPADNVGPMVSVTVESGKFQVTEEAGPVFGENNVQVLVYRDLGFALDDEEAYTKAVQKAKRTISPIPSKPPVFADPSQQLVRIDIPRDDLSFELVTSGKKKAR